MVKEEYKKATTKTGIGSTYKPELVNKLNRYCSLAGINRIQFVSDLIEKELSNKILDNNFIELEEPYYSILEENYFNFGSKINPVKNFNELDLYDEYEEDLTRYVYLFKKISNNLDVWSNEYNTYCYNNNPNLHKGVYIYINASIKSEYTERIPVIFLYDSSTEELEIEFVPSFIALKNKLNLDVSHHDFLVDLDHNSKSIENNIFSYNYDQGVKILSDVNYKLYYEVHSVISQYIYENGLKERLYIDYDYKGSDVIGFCIENDIYYDLD